MVKKYININELLEASSGRLKSLQVRRRERSLVLSHVRAALPAELKASVVTAGIEAGRLTVGVSGAAWATRLRYLAKALREQIAGALGREIHSVRIKVVQSSPPDVSARH
jgi:hypothetical protein